MLASSFCPCLPILLFFYPARLNVMFLPRVKFMLHLTTGLRTFPSSLGHRGLLQLNWDKHRIRVFKSRFTTNFAEHRQQLRRRPDRSRNSRYCRCFGSVSAVNRKTCPMSDCKPVSPDQKPVQTDPSFYRLDCSIFDTRYAQTDFIRRFRPVRPTHQHQVRWAVSPSASSITISIKSAPRTLLD